MEIRFRIAGWKPTLRIAGWKPTLRIAGWKLALPGLPAGSQRSQGGYFAVSDGFSSVVVSVLFSFVF